VPEGKYFGKRISLPYRKTNRMFTIRPATLDDVDQVRLLEKELINHERSVSATIKEDEELRYQNIPGLIADKEKTNLLVMEMDGQLIACAFGQIREDEHIFKEPYFGYIGMVSVKKEYRGKGYGRDIIDALIAWFKTKNLRNVKLQVFAENTGAARAYKKLGFEDFLTTMRLEI